MLPLIIPIRAILIRALFVDSKGAGVRELILANTAPFSIVLSESTKKMLFSYGESLN
ncbi:hypothetical protein acsn021_35890 [Anaerocolumna cellulosilytica]|uniref:Uncharacterized protein n=1 Tax=Anaerocolumna cellulosilytica TaxID=433286 RepID=A0A6S6R9A4_9FIRM|nr:hypothetical protein [Anaerocolumna cellulosilytica]MBB5195487.1 hypothetical protein [Anaerocolumna cellulosilytica]BCJ96020.1 hypothetical protein acsn021_35890 [Anaerocolumna cellulosilytica]